MGDSEELRAGEYKITWKSVTSSRLDSKALKAAAPELVERFTKTTTAAASVWREKKAAPGGPLPRREPCEKWTAQPYSRSITHRRQKSSGEHIQEGRM